MAGSQLKRLKAALREQGVIGPQQSKKQKKQNAQDRKATSDKRIQRAEALSNIREQFNPFQFKTNARGPKFDVTTNKPTNEKSLKGVMGRPGAAKAASEEKRRETLLVEMQRRNKVGGLVDRRLGENDASMSVEDKMMERFVQEKMRTHKRSAVFDLEEDDDMEDGLTHMGQPLTFDKPLDEAQDDFDETDLPSDDGSDTQNVRKALKRARLAELGDIEEDDGQPERKKTKKEVYEEIIAKSKAHKIQRQMTKEADDDLRLQIDQELPELRSLLFQTAKPQPPKASDAPSALIAGMDKDALDKDYDLRIKKMAQDKRSQPTNKTKSEEEIAQEAAEKLQELEQQRIKRMKGLIDSESEDEDDSKPESAPQVAKAFEADQFGLGKGIKVRATATELGLDDEDDFLIEDDLIASGSELDLDLDDDMDDDDQDSSESDAEEDSDDDDEFTKGLLTEAESKDVTFHELASAKGNDSDGIPYTFSCPQTHDELLAIIKDVDGAKLPVVIQRIRALYHPRLDSKNKERLGNFAKVLVQHIAFLAEESDNFSVLESVIRHVHSLAKTFPIEVAQAYRQALEQAEKTRPLSLEVSDLAILTAVGTTFPTSDHFHQVVTPAILCISRYLGQCVPKSLSDYAVGTYLSILAIQYQQLSKRFVPEVINFALNTLALAPTKPEERFGLYPHHEPVSGLRVKAAQEISVRKLSWNDCTAQDLPSEAASSLKIAILDTTISALKAAAELWASHAAYQETFQPVLRALDHLASKACRKHLPEALLTRIRDTTTFISRLTQIARLSRRPLELHHHKPLPIRTSAPRFDEDGFSGRVKDPDRERAELAKLKAEHRKERKGAMRELRRDAAFVARENLRQKRARDEAYEAKYKRLVAEIQGEEGRAANEYEREKKLRQKKRGGH